jgi:hypothetical protein
MAGKFSQRHGQFDSKKFFRNVACCVATVIIIKLAWTLNEVDGMDDMAFVWLFLAYLISVGGFDILLEAIKYLRGVPVPVEQSAETDTLVREKLD